MVLDSLKEVGTPSEFGALQRVGSRLREILGPSALATIALQEIEDLRSNGLNVSTFRGRLFIVQSLKRTEEVDLLREAFGRSFFLLSAHSKRKFRLRRLADAIKKRSPGMVPKAAAKMAAKLDRTDFDPHGQSFRGPQLAKTFPLADVFIDADHAGSRDQMIDRFVQLLFGNPFRTPTKVEFGMFHAEAAMVRSSALPRQVGAAIARKEGEIVSVGTNDVPQGGGGLYWEGDPDDARDFRLFDVDPSDERKKRILQQILALASNHPAPPGAPKGVRLSARQQSVFVDKLYSSMEFKAADFNVIDVARTVHAEMDALMDAARRGVGVEGCILYTTTFPCHNCAKHIVAAGIRRVHYIEPYPKSIAADLYPDSIEVDPDGDPAGGSVAFTPYVGIGPRRYLELFSAPKRTDEEGRIRLWKPGAGACRFGQIPVCGETRYSAYHYGPEREMRRGGPARSRGRVRTAPSSEFGGQN